MCHWYQIEDIVPRPIVPSEPSASHSQYRSPATQAPMQWSYCTRQTNKLISLAHIGAEPGRQVNSPSLN